MKTPTKTCVLAAAAMITSAATAQSYELEVLPVPDTLGVSFFSFSAISNDARLITEVDPTFNQVGHVARGANNEIIDSFQIGLPFLDYPTYNDINNRGTTVGYVWHDGATHGWLRDMFGNVQTFDDPTHDIYLYGVNDRHVAVGEMVDPLSFDFSPVIADDAGLHPVDVPGTNPLGTWLADINNAGIVTGGTYAPNAFEQTGFVWDSTDASSEPKMIEIDGTTFVSPRAINNRGQVAGFYLGDEFDTFFFEYPEYSFIREADGEIRTVDIDISEFYEPVFNIDPAIFGDPTLLSLTAVLQKTSIRIEDMNDRGQLKLTAKGFYELTLEFDGFPPLVIPLWSIRDVIATPIGDAH